MTDTPLAAKMRILLVEAEAHDRGMIVGLLSQLKVGSVLTAPRGADALMQVVDRRPDLVLYSLAMPDLDGRSFLTSLRLVTVMGIGRTPVVMMVDASDEAGIRFSAEASPFGCLIRPVSLNALRERIDNIVGADARLLADLRQRP